MLNFSDLKWIECNLPFDIHDCPLLTEEQIFDLNKREKETFGFTVKELNQKFKEKYPTYDVPMNDPKYPEFLKDLRNLEDLEDKIADWYNLQPEEVEIKNALTKMVENTFCGKGLNKPGTIVEINKRLHLIGTMSSYGFLDGYGKECTEVVTRYAVVVDWKY